MRWTSSPESLVIGTFVPMAMMQIGIVRVLVPHRRVFMPMRMRFNHRSVVAVLMMFVVDMTVLVRRRLVSMKVFMPFGQM